MAFNSWHNLKSPDSNFLIYIQKFPNQLFNYIMTKDSFQGSFFDSDDTKYEKFDFFKPKISQQKHLQTTPTLTNSLKCKDLSSNRIRKGMFALYGHLLAHYKVKI